MKIKILVALISTFWTVSAAYGECEDDLSGINNSASLDGKPLEGYGARTAEDFASAALDSLYAHDPNHTIEKIVSLNSWSILRDEDRWADVAMSAVTGGSLATQEGFFYNNNFAVCADNGQCAGVSLQIDFIREDNVGSSFVNFFMDGMLSDTSQNGAWDSTVGVGMPHTYVYNIQSYTAYAFFGGEQAEVTHTPEHIQESHDYLGGLIQPSSFGTAEQAAAIADKTCRLNDGTPQDAAGDSGSGGTPDYEDYMEYHPWADWEESWGIHVRCWYINTEQGSYSNCS